MTASSGWSHFRLPVFQHHFHFEQYLVVFGFFFLHLRGEGTCERHAQAGCCLLDASRKWSHQNFMNLDWVNPQWGAVPIGSWSDVISSALVPVGGRQDLSVVSARMALMRWDAYTNLIPCGCRGLQSMSCGGRKARTKPGIEQKVRAGRWEGGRRWWMEMVDEKKSDKNREITRERLGSN